MSKMSKGESLKTKKSLSQKVARKSWTYDVLRASFGFSFSKLYCKKFYVQGLENLPSKENPMMIVSNHQNGLNDALLILFGLPRKHVPVYLARADIFKNPKIAAILYFLRIMPIYRIRDGKNNLAENDAVFNESVKVVEAERPLCMFPEGQHQEGHWMGTVKKGFARIAFQAAEGMNFPDNFMIVPVSNHYEKYHGYRGRVLLTFGKPIRLADYYEQYKENQQHAFLNLASDAEKEISKNILNIDVAPEYYEAIDFARKVENPPQKDFRKQLQQDLAFMERVHAMPEKELKEYSEKMLALKSTHKLQRRRNWLKTAALFPLAVIGFVLHAIPTLTGENLAKNLSKNNKMLRGGIEYVLSEIILTTLFYFAYTALFFVFCPVIWYWTFPLFVAMLFATKVSWLEVR